MRGVILIRRGSATHRIKERRHTSKSMLARDDLVRSPGGGGSAVIFGFMSGANGGFTSAFGDRYGGIPLPGVIGGVGFPGTGEWG